MRVLFLLSGCFFVLLLVASCASQEFIDQTEVEQVDVPDMDESLYKLDRAVHRVGDGDEETMNMASQYRKALKLMEAEDFEPAIVLLNEYIAYDPHAYSANRNLGRAYWLTGKFSLALYQFGRILHIAEEDGSKGHRRVAHGLTADFLTDLAHSFSKVFRAELDHLLEKRKALAVSMPLDDCVERVVNAESKEDLVDIADEYYAIAMEYLDVKDKIHYQQWAHSISQHGRYKKAIEVIRMGLDSPSNPDEPAYDQDMYKLLAEFHKNLGKYDKCIKFGTSALTLGAVDVVFIVSDCYALQGKHAKVPLLTFLKAWTLLEETAVEYPVLNDIVLFTAYKAQLSAQQGEVEKALAYYDEALDMATDVSIQGVLYSAKAKLEDSLGDYDQAFLDQAISADLFYGRWLHNQYKAKWVIADKVCPRKQIFTDHISDFALIDSRKIVHFGDEFYGAKVTPLALPSVSTDQWTQRIELQFEDLDVHHTVVKHAAVFGKSNLNVQECGLLLSTPIDQSDALGIFKVVGQTPKGVFLGPGGDYEDLAWLLLHNLPQLLVLKDDKVFDDKEMQVVAPDTDIFNQVLDIAGLSGRACGYEPSITSLFVDELHMTEFTAPSEEEVSVAMEDNMFVSKWALKRARAALIPGGDLPKSERTKVVVIKTMRKKQQHMNVFKQSLLHEALKEAFDEVVIFNPYSPKFTFEKMQRVFQGAAAIVGPHSPGLAGMIYAAPGTPIIEMPVQGGSHNLYANVATALDHPYWIVPTAQAPALGDYLLTEEQRADVVATVQAAIDIDGAGVHVPLKARAAVHDEL